MRDLDIRSSLRLQLETTHAGDPDTLILDELGLCQGEARVDLAVVNGLIHGFEIKSERDTLARLAGQAAVYDRALDAVSVVAACSHVEALFDRIPEWWGVHVARAAARSVIVEEIRPASTNPNVDPFAVVQLLWHQEAIEIVARKQLDTRPRARTKRRLWELLAGSLPLDELRHEVRRCLRARANWRPAPPQA
ncbi:MAG: sce7726 family protein [Dehalococcoidia bacterium]|nr:sce7726 family protein [Dehalococcoidia bacterium]